MIELRFTCPLTNKTVRYTVVEEFRQNVDSTKNPTMHPYVSCPCCAERTHYVEDLQQPETLTDPVIEVI